MVTFEQLKNFDPKSLRQLAGVYDRLARRLVNRADGLHKQISGMSWHWEGKAYDAAGDRFRRIRREIDDTEAPLTSMGTTVDGAADDLQRAKGMLLDALDAATKIPATVSADGETITYTGPDLDKERRIAVSGQMTAVLDDIDAALSAAQKADQAAADALGKLVPGYDPTDPGKGKVPKSEIPKPGSDPRKVNKWWNSLTPAERQYLIHHHPDRIGNLDGIPVVARDQANRVRLAREHEDADARKRTLLDRKRQLEKDLAGAGANDMRARPARAELARINRELALINNNIKGMEAIEDRLYRPGGAPAYLIGFEPGTLEDRDGNGNPDDDGRAIVAIGNPDTADNIATYVPGTGADLEGIGGDIERADRMSRDALKMPGGENTSVIVWLGYDAPDEVNPNAVSASYAEDAVADLNRFQDGLRVTHDGSPSHNTVIGHSYGTTVIGHAASADVDGNGAPDGVHADDLVFVASPGVGVSHASDLGVGGDHVWATRADGDPIEYATWAGALGHGTDPVDGAFGGNQFTSDPGGHSDYWDKGKISRRGMAGIITGNYDRVPSHTPSPPPQSGPPPSPSPDSTPSPAPTHPNPNPSPRQPPTTR